MLMIHTAMQVEARALINHYQLKRQYDIKTFACFTAEDIFLIASGIGKTNTATAIGWANTHIQTNIPVWLNVGMAGHASHEVGEYYLAQKIEDGSSGQCHHPPQSFAQEYNHENLLTIDKPVNGYPADNMVDMEASAFISAASRFTPLELIQSIKVISDNRQNPPRRLKARAVESLFTPHIDTIDQLIRQLRLRRDDILNKTDA